MEITIGKALEYSVLGILIVFVLIIVLMLVVRIMSAVVVRVTGTSGGSSGPGTAQSKSADVPSKERKAPGSAGDVKLYQVPDREAAMIMAIVAEKLQMPLNELRFLSIREVKEDEI